MSLIFSHLMYVFINTVNIENIGADTLEQTVQTQIRLLLWDQDLHCLQFCLHNFDTFLW